MDAGSSLLDSASVGPIAAIRGASVGQLWVLGGTPSVLAVSCVFASLCCGSAPCV